MSTGSCGWPDSPCLAEVHAVADGQRANDAGGREVEYVTDIVTGLMKVTLDADRYDEIRALAAPGSPTLREALERIAEQQQETLRVIRDNGFVFDSLGREPGNWQHLAFTIYTHLCEVDVIARQALDLPIGAVGGGSGEPAGEANE